MSLYRKYRPQQFSEVVGQEHIKTVLTNALQSGRFSHAYLFCGPKGSGKTTTARLLAKALNCRGRELSADNFEPCNKCSSCLEVASGQSMDVIEIDAASNRGIDEIRELREKIKFAPTTSKYKVYVIDECHMLTKEAFNALLKTLEEPPKHAIFILATTELHKVPATILSRVQAFDFKKAKLDEIQTLLSKVVKKEKILIADEALGLISRLSFGAFRDALSMLDQVASLNSESEQISLEKVQAILGQATQESVWQFIENIASKDRKKALNLIEELYFEGTDLENFIGDIIRVFRQLLLVKAGVGSSYELAESDQIRAIKIAENFSVAEIIGAVEKLADVSTKVKTSVLGQLPLEVAVFELTGDKTTDHSLPASPAGRQATGKTEELIDSSQIKAPMKVVPSLAKKDESKENKKEEQERSVEIKEEKAEKKEKNNVGQNTDSIITPAVWKQMINEIKVHNNALAATLNDAIIQNMENGAIILAVKFKFHAERVQDKKNSQAIEESLKKITGQTYIIKCIVEPKLEIQKPRDQEEELLEGAMEVFDVVE